MITAVRPGHMITCNASHFKKITDPSQRGEKESSEKARDDMQRKQPEVLGDGEGIRRYPLRSNRRNRPDYFGT